VSGAEATIVRVERLVDLGLLAAGVALMLFAPAARVWTQPSLLIVWGGAALLASGLARDLARLALEERGDAPRAATGAPKELRVCLESALGGLAVAGGLAWRIAAPAGGQAIGLGAFVLGLAVVVTFGHLSRNVIVVFRIDAAHRNILPWS
jgi:hypothetical protein